MNYAYCCPICLHQFEKMLPIAERDTALCPICGTKANRKWSAPLVQYKGQGFYKTDYISTECKKELDNALRDPEHPLNKAKKRQTGNDSTL
jgi:putative FmdB family regulatory protein